MTALDRAGGLARLAWIAALLVAAPVASAPRAPAPAPAVEGGEYLLFSPQGLSQGSLRVSAEGADYAIEWSSKFNGRGTETRERLTLGAAGAPVEWEIDEVNDFTGASKERLWTGEGKLHWRRAGADAASSDDPRAFYVPERGSAWAIGLYAARLRALPSHRAPALPDGELRLELLDGQDFAGESLQRYRLHGYREDPVEILLDAEGRVVAVGDGTLVAAGREALGTHLREQAMARARQKDMDRHAALTHVFDGPVRIHGVRIFDPETGTLSAPASVRFQAGRIASIDPADAPSVEGEVRIDGEGGTLVPGLHDTHYHASLARSIGGLMSLAAGVTTARDMGSQNDDFAAYREDVRSGRLAGPRLVPGGMIEGVSDTSLRDTGVIVESRDEAVTQVRRYAEQGYRWIKVYNSVDAGWVPAIAEQAHALGLRVMGHIPAFSTADAMVEAGYDEVVHANQLMLGWVIRPGEDTRTPLRLLAMSRFADLDLDSPQVRRTVELIKSRGVAVEPTLAIMERLLLARKDAADPRVRWWFEHFPEDARLDMVTVMPDIAILPVSSEADDAAYRAAARKMVELVRLLDREGVPLNLGSDDNNGFVLLRELELFVDAGFTPARALARATLGAARYLGTDDRTGRIAVGRSADFFLVPGDPTADIKALHRNRMTVAGGRVYFPEEIYRAVGIRPFEKAPTVEVPVNAGRQSTVDEVQEES